MRNIVRLGVLFGLLLEVRQRIYDSYFADRHVQGLSSQVRPVVARKTYDRNLLLA